MSDAPMTGHTPGPWKWADNHRGLYGPDEAIILDWAPYEGMWIADIETNGKANAALIEAAPRLLETLREARDYIAANAPVNSYGLLDKNADRHDRKPLLERIDRALGGERVSDAPKTDSDKAAELERIIKDEQRELYEYWAHIDGKALFRERIEELERELSEKTAEIERLDHLHKLDHSLADQWQAQNEALRQRVEELETLLRNIRPYVYGLDRIKSIDRALGER